MSLLQWAVIRSCCCWRCMQVCTAAGGAAGGAAGAAVRAGPAAGPGRERGAGRGQPRRRASAPAALPAHLHVGDPAWHQAVCTLHRGQAVCEQVPASDAGAPSGECSASEVCKRLAVLSAAGGLAAGGRVGVWVSLLRGMWAPLVAHLSHLDLSVHPFLHLLFAAASQWQHL